MLRVVYLGVASILMLGLMVVGAQETPVALLPMNPDLTLTPEKALAQGQVATTQGAGDEVQPWQGYAVAESLAVNGNPQAAIEQLNARLVSAPDDAKAAYLKGMILMQQGKREEAERWFKMMQSNFPELPQAYNALAVLYAAREELVEAAEVLRALLEKYPDNETARLNLANIYLNLAEVELKKALKDAPDNAMIANTLQGLEALRD